MRLKLVIALLFGWSHLMFELSTRMWLVEGSSGYNYYYYVSLLCGVAQIMSIVTAFGAALTLLDG
jgi:hypothetical protein